VNSHAAVAAELLGDRAMVQAILEDVESARVGDDMKALFRLISKVTLCARSIRQEDIDLAKSVGWSDEALYDAITVCALFNFLNTWVDATGVHVLPDWYHQQAGKRLAEHGYMPKGPGPQQSNG
jgi:alkylhydroperoxidase family enzyme